MDMKKFTWAHGIIAAMLAFIIFILGMIFFFARDWQNAEMISDNYYEEELVYQKVIDAKQRVNALKEKPKYIQTEKGITIVFPQTVNNANSSFYFNLFRTDDQRFDVKKDFRLEFGNSFTIPGEILLKGHYTLKVHWVQNAQEYQIDYDVLWK